MYFCGCCSGCGLLSSSRLTRLKCANIFKIKQLRCWYTWRILKIFPGSPAESRYSLRSIGVSISVSVATAVWHSSAGFLNMNDLVFCQQWKNTSSSWDLITHFKQRLNVCLLPEDVTACWPAADSDGADRNRLCLFLCSESQTRFASLPRICYGSACLCHSAACRSHPRHLSMTCKNTEAPLKWLFISDSEACGSFQNKVTASSVSVQRSHRSQTRSSAVLLVESLTFSTTNRRFSHLSLSVLTYKQPELCCFLSALNAACLYLQLQDAFPKPHFLSRVCLVLFWLPAPCRKWASPWPRWSVRQQFVEGAASPGSSQPRRR